MTLLKRILIVVLTITFVLGVNVDKARAATPTVGLGAATGFTILAGTPNITDAGGTSAITGNVGLSPATGAGIGLLAAQVTGTIYAVDGAGPAGSTNDPATLTSAKNDLTTAYTDAAGRVPAVVAPTELGGTTKTPGIYTSAATTFGITAGAGPLVLDGQGDVNAVFIFEAAAEQASALTVGPGSTVTLINGASACNVFWRVYGATIDTTARFQGNILALTSITVANGANITGKLLARNGNVTLINDVIASPVCAVVPATIVTAATPTPVPGLPSTGSTSQNSILWYLGILVVILVVVLISIYAVRKKTKKLA